MPFLEIISVDSAVNGIAKIYDAAKARAGGVANIIKAMNLDAASCRASLALYISLMKSVNGLDSATRELLISGLFVIGTSLNGGLRRITMKLFPNEPLNGQQCHGARSQLET